jgi:hypothetical protein
MWLHGSQAPVTNLNIDGSGMNLWGSKGVYLTKDLNVASRFGPCLNKYDIEDLIIIDTDKAIDDEHYSIVMGVMRDMKVSSSMLPLLDLDSYGDVIASGAEFSNNNREDVVMALKAKLGFDALRTLDVSGSLDGEIFNEGELLVLLDASKAKHVGFEYIRMPTIPTQEVPESVILNHYKVSQFAEQVFGFVKENETLPNSALTAKISEMVAQSEFGGDASVMVKMSKLGKSGELAEKIEIWNPVFSTPPSPHDSHSREVAKLKLSL